MTKPDCIADCFDQEVFDAVSRHFTVGYASRYTDPLHLLALTIKGQWVRNGRLQHFERYHRNEPGNRLMLLRSCSQKR